MLSERERKTLALIADPDTLGPVLPYLTAHSGQGECKGYCPFCEEPGKSKSPSAGFNFKNNKWSCRGKCGQSGKVTQLVRRLEADGGNVIDIKTGKPKKATNLPTQEQLESMCTVLMRNQTLMRYLTQERGLTPKTIDEWCIGWLEHQPRPRSYVIPVFDGDDEEVLSVRLYKRKTQSKRIPKMIYWGTGNHATLFNSSILKDEDEVVICAGEWDCILSNQHGIPTVTHTGGEGTWMGEWSSSFKGKVVFICYDDDDGGRSGAVKVATALEGIAKEIYIINLDTGIKGGDITDFYVTLGRDANDFRAVMEKARANPFTTKEKDVALPMAGRNVALGETYNVNMQEPLEMHVQVAGRIDPGYLAPRRIVARCNMKKGDVCKVCPMLRFGGERVINTRPDDPKVLLAMGVRESANESNGSGKKGLLAGFAEARCTSHSEFSVEAYWGIEQLSVVQALGAARPGEVQKPADRVIFNVSAMEEPSPISGSLRMIGKQIPDPRNQNAVLQAWHSESLDIDIDKFRVTEELLDDLAVFQTDPGQTPLEKCLDIAEDLAANVTHIYQRGLLHVAADLVWHSIMGFDLLGRRESKGWVEGLIIGDTRTGKSEIAQRLTRHYKAGRFVSCEAMTFAGLVGGAQQINGKQWTVTWGLVPMSDRRMLVLDEFSGLKEKDVIERMSSVRSDGIAQISMIARNQTSARTRLLWISNPVKGRHLAETSGIRAIRDLITQPEDIARFDFALAARSDEVSSKIINSIRHQKVDHVYTSPLCNKLVMWAWSRRPEQIKWTGKAELEILKAAEALGSRYIDEPPLVQAANVRVKLARLAAAFAARTFSTDAKGENVKVLTSHVQSAVDFLDTIYSTDAMGYAQYSQKRLRDREASLANRNDVYAFLKEHEGVYEVLEAVRDQRFKGQDFDGADDEFADGGEILKWLRARKMIRRIEGNYHLMEPALIQVMKKLEEEGL